MLKLNFNKEGLEEEYLESLKMDIAQTGIEIEVEQVKEEEELSKDLDKRLEQLQESSDWATSIER